MKAQPPKNQKKSDEKIIENEEDCGKKSIYDIKRKK
jgi:hypothetical protein